MAIALYPHNLAAYEKTIVSLSAHRRAAVIHPTGTGKSFIGFKLCEDNADKTICWLAPSEYIFKTQLENLAESGAELPANIKFFTYAKLMFLSEEECAAIGCDYIVLDEFHRCGAEMWGQGVERLLNMYGDAYLLGLSATHIRYLDNQRNMADELFNGNVASEMTLGEAIARGILPAPKYVTALFSYQDQLEEYEKRVAKLSNPFQKDRAQQYLEALRRALEKADGLDNIFARHITKQDGKYGKYIVFCANKEHMDAMIAQSAQWFAKVDAAPHIYTVYCNDAESDKNYKAFKQDESDHLKLLFTIDMLNEGIHLNVGGVLLLRPTISPIIYRQQIGRALSVSKGATPVIFDIVNNFENLYSIGAIEQEMQNALLAYRDYGMGEQIVTERFELIEFVRDCKQLFDDLQESLTISWDTMYASAKAFYIAQGHLNVPVKHKTPEGYSLGAWLRNQRYIRKGELYGNLTAHKIAQLDAIGMYWENTVDVAWNRVFDLLKAFYETNGAGSRLEDSMEFALDIHEWLSQQRKNFRAGRLPTWRIAKLNSIGFVWEPTEENWQSRYEAVQQFAREHGHLPNTQEDMQLFSWLKGQRTAFQNNRLATERVQLLEAIGVDFLTSHGDRYWNTQADAVAAFVAEHKRFPYKSEKLGLWLYKEMARERQGRLQAQRKARLEQIGVVFGDRADRAFAENIKLLQVFVAENGRLPNSRDKQDGFLLGAWYARMRKQEAQGALKAEHAQRLAEFCDNNFAA